MGLGVHGDRRRELGADPASLKLAVDLGLNRRVCAIARLRLLAGSERRMAARNCGVAACSGWCLSGIALIGQIYHCRVPPWRAACALAGSSARRSWHSLRTHDWTGTIWAIAGGHDVVRGKRSDPRSSGADRGAAAAALLLGAGCPPAADGFPGGLPDDRRREPAPALARDTRTGRYADAFGHGWLDRHLQPRHGRRLATHRRQRSALARSRSRRSPLSWRALRCG
jgi:hypothetical protein